MVEQGGNDPRLIIDRNNLTTPEGRERLWVPRFGILAISGAPGAGTSTLARMEGEEYKIPVDYVGELMRKATGTTERSIGFTERDPLLDLAIDEGVRHAVSVASVDNPRVIEAQIGCATALDEYRKLEAEGKAPDAPIVKIHIWATKEIRIDRLKAASDAKGEGKSRAEIERETNERERENPGWWRGLYPDLIGEDSPHKMNARTAQGKRMYDYEINSTQMTPEEVQEELHDFLSGLRFIVPNIESARPTKTKRLFAGKPSWLFGKSQD